MKKKMIAGALALASAAVLAACSQSANNNTDIISMKGDTITVGEFYDKVKTNSAAQQVLLSMAIKDVFEKKYSKNVTDKEVTEAYDKSVKSYGDNFQRALAQAGLNEDSYREQIRTNKLVEYAVKKAAEKELTDANYKAAYEEYTPEVTAQIIKLDSEDKAKQVLEQVKAEGADFAQIAKDNSTDSASKDKGGEIKFDSTTANVAADLKKAAFSLEPNAISEVINVKEGYTDSYYILKLVSKTEKSAKWEDYKEKLKQSIMTQKQNDPSFIQSVVAKELQEANIKVKDQAFQNVFAQYISSTGSSEASSTSSSSANSSSSQTSSSAAE
ncbi:peptidylprolyl isomerase PrsA [Streptococcus oricebi]|uniref:Foldase protein PrsA n=1 Tax=Streptococcus oricebi TaxID=1547447 RepID=A0ABS5B255_9STRE|nr:peptidylprolyl isomerase PrsA [Streptococcus oricebi]MBP2622850.1 foldase PrsA [Streptococcus oricebi]